MSAPDLAQARRFLELLNPEAEAFTFQTFDDREPKRKWLAKVMHGSLDDVAPRLEALQKSGAGVFVAVNETDLQGRKEENVTRARAVFADLDGAPMQAVLACGIEPHVIVASSPNKFHAYWLADDLPLGQFEAIQRAIAAKVGGDPTVHDLPRVMRLPGFLHQKGDPFYSHIVHVNERLPYHVSEILAEFEPGPQPQANGQTTPPEEWFELVTKGVGKGARNHTIARLAGLLFQCLPDPEVAAELIACFNAVKCRPPLETEELNRTLESIAATELKRWRP